MSVTQTLSMDRNLVGLALFVLLILLLGFNGPWVNLSLSYDRGALQDGQLWRIITGHMVHSNTWHTLMNLAVLLVSASVIGHAASPLKWLGVFLSLCLLVSAGLYFNSDDVVNYVGLSGVLYGILSFGLIMGIKQNKALYSVVLLCIAGKIFWEQLPGYDVTFLKEKINAIVIVDAHLYGFVGGVLIAIMASYKCLANRLKLLLNSPPLD